jgi:gluconate kinase
VARAVDLSASPGSLEGWTPIRVHWRDEPVVEWCWTDGLAFTDPFFVQTVERAFRTPYSLLFRRETPLDGLEPGLEPSGFVLHVSRCGSTLVSQMLASVPQHLVLSEPVPVEHILGSPASEADRVRWLRGIVSALGRPRKGDGRGYVLKLDAWHACHLGTIRRAFPAVPWVFLFREPVQVLASHFRHRGAHMVPGAIDPALFGLDRHEIARMPSEEYCARVLAAICRAALEHHDEQALFVDYRELPSAVLERVLPALGLECDAAERASMEAVTRLDAKNPVLPFSDDSTALARQASPELREAAERWVRPLYDELLAC